MKPHFITAAPSQAANTSIDIQKLAVSYGGKTILKGVDLPIYEHQITALVGPSGCGKSSLLMCLNRLIDLIPDSKVSGTILFRGEDIYQPTIDTVSLRRKVGLILQKPNPFPFSIWRNLAYPLKEHGVCDKRQIDEKIESVLRDVGLWNEVKDRLKTSALDLSGGQQQRLCIARALVLQPEVLLMDEPCSALDPISSQVLERLIKRLRQRYTIAIVTHNLAQARRLADRVAMFWVHENCGCLIESGTADNIFSNPQHSLTAAYISGIRG